MRKIAVKITALFLVLLSLTSTFVSGAAVVANELDAEESTVAVSEESGETAQEPNETPEENENNDIPEENVPAAKPSIKITSEQLTIKVRKTVQMTATIENVDPLPLVAWRSSDSSIASVDGNGLVRGVNPGRATITASIVVNGEVYSDSFILNVTTSSHFIKDYLAKQQVLGYQYSYIDDYYYTNDKDCWQYDYGFGPIYDLVAPYILLEYDYVRVFFTYEDKDWMVQLWKGQYGLLFYGSEMGVYNKPHSDKDDNVFTFYNCPPEEDWLGMEMTMYHQNLKGEYVRELSRDYDKYWWCTGFKGGQLRVQEPADELRMTGRITMKDEEMTRLFVDGLKECKFTQAKSKEALAIDQFYVDGCDVYLSWQNINDAENTMALKVIGGAATVWTLLPVIIPALPMLIPMVGIFGIAMLFLSLVI